VIFGDSTVASATLVPDDNPPSSNQPKPKRKVKSLL
jgi:hypothetical protein